MLDKNQSLILASIIFGFVALVHLLISIFNWRIRIGNLDIPIFFSYAQKSKGFLAS